MTTRRTLLKSAAVAGGLALSPTPASAATSRRKILETADRLFTSGDFTAADRLYRKVLTSDPDHVHALAQHAYLTLLANRQPTAIRLLKQVLRLEPGHTRSLSNLANALWRADRFAELAEILPSVKKDGPTATVEQLRNLAGRKPYDVAGPKIVKIPFAATDPLPMIEASLNGAPPELFFLDTGALFALNDDYADELGIPTYGYTTGKTVYGEHKAYQGRVGRLAFDGGLRIDNLPVHTIPDAIRLTAPDGRVTRGAIGTSVLARFLSTIDYPDQALILRRNKHTSIRARHSTSMWFLGDHYLLSHGTVNHLDRMVFFIDTGGGDIGFTAPLSTFAAAGIEIPAGEGLHPVTVPRLALGSAVRHDVSGLAGAFPEWFESDFGFRIGGLPTHQFFQPYALTFDFVRMRILMDPTA
ncbi:aspartyl protease family protein [Nonomuraea sp. NPDC050451]|uniref:aspartyl protease family protein n=1 Tax=Nonomuraea sp. NPDC050451 TaxID=3364364 RepID=UPI00378C8312